MDNFDRSDVIETPRLILSFISERDEHGLFENICHDKEVIKYYLTNYVENEDNSPVGRWINYYLNNRAYAFAVRLKSDGTTIGMLNQVRDESEKGVTELGYALGSKYWGRGYATEALGAAIEFFFGKGIEKIECSYIKGNDASRRVMEKCGMKFAGEIENGIEFGGKKFDIVNYSIVKTEKIYRN